MTSLIQKVLAILLHTAWTIGLGVLAYTCTAIEFKLLIMRHGMSFELGMLGFLLPFVVALAVVIWVQWDVFSTVRGKKH